MQGSKIGRQIKKSREHLDKSMTDIERAGENVRESIEGAVESAKLKFLNMAITHRGERIIRDKLTVLGASSFCLAIFLLVVMTDRPAFFFTAIIIGVIAAGFDFAVEYKGIHFTDWDYSSRTLTFKNVPLQLPMLFFSTGVAVVFIMDCFTADIMYVPFKNIGGANISPIQIFLIFVGSLYIFRYFTHAVDSITFGALPIALAVYLYYPEPWMLVVSMAPVYIDYHLEKRMVNSADITYDNYSFEKAFNVAISYFPASLLMFSIAAVIYNLLSGVF